MIHVAKIVVDLISSIVTYDYYSTDKNLDKLYIKIRNKYTKPSDEAIKTLQTCLYELDYDSEVYYVHIVKKNGYQTSLVFNNDSVCDLEVYGSIYPDPNDSMISADHMFDNLMNRMKIYIQ